MNNRTILKTRVLENLHILLWLAKDSCWMLEWKLAGTVMFFPTLSMAIYICWMHRKDKAELYASLAVCSWILANATWMFHDFYTYPSKTLALAFFVNGFLWVFFYIYEVFIKKNNNIIPE